MEFERRGVLGQGSYGTVYRAIFPGYRVFFAVKSSEIENSESLINEERILKHFVGSQEIIQCYGNLRTKEDGKDYHNLILEYAPAGCLYNYIRENGKLPEWEVRYFTRTLVKGLMDMHMKGIVHGDFKPSNVLMFPKGNDKYGLKIADFGLSRIVEEEKKRGESVKDEFHGTKSYMSPESFADGAIEPPMDIWALGCTVLEMMTGRAVWTITSNDQMKAIVQARESPMSLPETCYLPDDCYDFLHRCFMFHPKSRSTANMLLRHPFISNLSFPHEPSFCQPPRVLDSNALGTPGIQLIRYV